MLQIEVDFDRCSGCGICADFCPVSVFEMDADHPKVVRLEACWGCETCSGQCPAGAIRILQDGAVAAAQPEAFAPPVAADVHRQCAEWAATLDRILRLRWKPVAITLIPQGEPLPDVPLPPTRLRYCQTVMAARRGKPILMPASCHACPDGTSILGLTEIPPKLASGEIYIQFGKIATIEAARQMVAERPCLPERSIRATLTTPLDDVAMKPDVIAIVARPEQMMWLSMAGAYFTGKKFNFKVSGYNAQCVETTLLPYRNGEINISLGCYGCRGSSDVEDELMFMGIPFDRMPKLIEGLELLNRKAIPDARKRIYLPPLV